MKSKRAFAIPVSLCVAGVVLFLGGSVTQLCAGDLQSATHEYYKERALQVADFGLEKGVVAFQNASASYTFQGLTRANQDDRVTVLVYDNTDGDLPANSGCPVTVPEGFQYWVATGEARNGSRVMASARIGAMVQWGQPLGSAGAQVHYLKVTPHSFNLPARFIAMSGQQLLPDKIICSTDAKDSAHPSDMLAPVTFRNLVELKGKVRIPVGADSNEVVQAVLPPSQTLTIDATGGLFNIPAYSPPTPKAVMNSASGSPSPTLLAPGEYGEVNLAQGTSLLLRGVYHFKTLNLLAGSGDYPRLLNDVSGGTEVFIDRITTSTPDLKLKLDNPQSTAKNFRINIQPAPLNALPLNIEVNAAKDTVGTFGGVWLVAPKRIVNVSSQTSAVIRGSFTCNTLGLNFGTGSSPTFIYDTTVDTSRQNPSGANQYAHAESLGGRQGDEGPQPIILSKNRL